MSIFPAIAPSSRVYSPGDIPSERKQSTGGTQYGFRRGNRRISQTLSLEYSHLAETDMLLIKDHYYDRDGTFDIFYLSAEVWGYFKTPPVPLISNFAWRYTSPPLITDVSYDRFNVEVELATVPIDIGDLSFNNGDATGSGPFVYIINASGASDTPARTFTIGGLGAQ